jgi:hypothetical protein
MRKSHLFVLIGVCLASGIADAQSFYSVRRNRSLIFIAGTGTSTYFGELKNDGDYMDAKPNLNVGLQYYFYPRLSARVEANWFQLSGDDALADDSFNGRKGRNLSFVSNNYEITASGMINLFPNATRYYQRPTFNVYGFAGIGFLYMNPKARNANGDKVALQPLMTEGVKYSRFQPVIPYGLGIRLKLGPFFNAAIEGGYRMIFTDYLDDVSTVHPDKTGWSQERIEMSDRRPELGLNPYPVGARRGNPDTNDGYFLANLKIEYYLPSTFALGDPSKRLYRQQRKGRKPKSR